ncbi:cell division protein DivIC (FtsB), stabilizes FtsL against RasP cleavage [Flagellimonas eckloniae]|uniref:Cell division protein DivIC (FtsB), stabilizes FtsL against RasP cleavage n=1 Tax=Flagellimonas eckloniae TaxID=346185 RepID=A0A0N8WFS0_9FLAO|nr:cell division protein DivIC (FtsB), stabilizes FtsL against RasP cleavage [Allomuricauda eckloniae]
MKRLFKHIYLQKRFFIVISIIVFAFLLSYMAEDMFGAVKILFYVFSLLFIVDVVLLFASKGKLKGQRVLPDKLSNGDENLIQLELTNSYLFPVSVKIIDEIPFQFQKRDFGLTSKIQSGGSKSYDYILRPTERGVYSFGSLNLFASSPIGFLARKYAFNINQEVPVYPSFLQLQKYDLIAFTNRLHEFGLKKIRRIGHTMEFEQIKEYVQGDDIRNINWKATAKRNQLMVNQYQDEKSQPIYSVIDKGRVMKMPFNELSLLDYAINATLVISNIALKKQDKAGMFSFSDKIENRVVAEHRSSQMNLILETLYNLETDFIESDFSRLYVDVKRNLNQRSLLLLYTNFETLDALHRQLPYLQAIAKQHLLVVIFFENTELTTFAGKKAETVHQIFEQTIAEKFIYEKKLIVNELRKYGIQTILTKPENLTINTINKYLEIKARGLI